MNDKIDVSGRVTFTKADFHQSRIYVKLKTDLLDERVIVDIRYDCIIIKRSSIDYQGRTIKFRKSKSGWYETTVGGLLPVGKYIIDEEDSTEDELIAYYD